MAARQYYSVRGIPLTALTSLIVGVAALGIVIFLLTLFSNELNPDTLAVGASAVSGDFLQVVVTWPGICFLLALAGLIAGLSASPEKRVDDHSRACTWICRAGIGLSLTAIFVDMLIISYLRVLASTLNLA